MRNHPRDEIYGDSEHTVDPKKRETRTTTTTDGETEGEGKKLLFLLFEVEKEYVERKKRDPQIRIGDDRNGVLETRLWPSILSIMEGQHRAFQF